MEVFDATRHARPIAPNLPIYRPDKDFGYALGIDATSEGMRVWKIWVLERVGCSEAMEVEDLGDVCLSFVSTEVCGREGGTCVEEGGHVSPLLEGWEEVGSVRASGWIEGNIPASKLWVGDHYRLCFFNLGVSFSFAAAVWPFHGHRSPSVVHCPAVDAYDALIFLRG